MAQQCVLEDVGPVGDQTVDTAIEQFLHFVGVVDRPDMDVDSGSVRTAYESGGHEPQTVAAMGDLQRGDVATGQPPGQSSWFAWS